MTRASRPAAGIPTLQLFVYGTLQRGQRYHDAFCAGALEIEPAFTRGRLFDLPAGYPALAVLPEDVLAEATGSWPADRATQQEWDARLAAEAPGAPGIGEPRAWGERLAFADAEARLRRLDRLEVFRPGRRSLYRRVLIRVWSGEEPRPGAVWTYVQERPGGTLLASGRWP